MSVASYSAMLDGLKKYPGDSAWPWVPEDDWDGAGDDYPAPGTRAIGEMHRTRCSRSLCSDELITGTTGTFKSHCPEVVIKPAIYTWDGWEEWEHTTIRNIRVRNVLARLAKAGYRGRVVYTLDREEGMDIDLSLAA